MYVLNNQSLDRKILETDPNICTSHFMRLISTDRYFMKKKVKKYLFRRMRSDVMFRHNVHIRGGVRASVLSYQRPQKHLICQFLYNIGGEMHFYQKNREKNLLKRHHSPQNHQSKRLYSGILAYRVLHFDTKK